jgi:predicted DNA-binding transcriptional regulator YafY
VACVDAQAIIADAAPAIAADLGVTTTRPLRDRLLVEPSGWWEAVDEVPFLPVVARAVFEGRLLRITYRDRDRVVSPLGLVVKGGTWYLLTIDRVYRVSRIGAADVLPHDADRPAGYDLAAAWEARKDAFATSIPTYMVRARVSPAGERLLHLLEEGTPALPLRDDVRRDDAGWAVLDLRFERVESAGRLLLRLGGDVEVLRPAAMRRWMSREVERLGDLYV